MQTRRHLRLREHGTAWPPVPTSAPLNPGDQLARVASSPGERSTARSMVGRDSEIRTIERALADTADGQGTLIVVTGDAGIGKSRLVREAVCMANRMMPVLVGAAPSVGHPTPWHPLVHALSRGLRSGLLELNGRDDALGAECRSVVKTLEEGHPTGDLSPFQVAEHVLHVLASLAEPRGAVLVLEDLHWADASTLHTIECLAPSLAAQRVLCLVTTRVEAGELSTHLAARLEEVGLAIALALGPLTERAVAEMIRVDLGTRAVPLELMAAVREHANGNPLAVERLVMSAIQSGALTQDEAGWRLDGELPLETPAGIAAVVMRRLARLEEGSRRVVETLAVLGGDADEPLLASTTGLSLQSIRTAIKHAVGARLVALSPDDSDASVRLTGTLTRETIMRQLLPSERAELADHALAALITTHPELPGEWREKAARLNELAGDHHAAARRFLAAGTRAEAAGELHNAERLLRRACALDGHEGRLIEAEEALLRVLASLGRCADALSVGESLLSRLDMATPHGSKAANTHLEIARAAVEARDLHIADRHIRAASGLPGTHRDSAVALRTVILKAALAPVQDCDQTELIHAVDDLQRAELFAEAAQGLRRVAEVQWHTQRGEVGATLRRARELARDRRLGHELLAVDAWLAIDHAATTCDCAPLTEIRAAAQKTGPSALVAEIDLWLGALHLLTCELSAARDALEECVLLVRRLGLNWPAASATLEQCRVLEGSPLGEDHLESGPLGAPARALSGLVSDDVEGARRDVAGTTVLVGSRGPWPWLPGLRALLSALTGDDSVADDVGRSGWADARITTGYLCLVRAIRWSREGNRRRATEEASHGLEELRPAPWFRHHAQRLLGKLALEQGWSTAEGWLREAIAFFEAAGHRELELACKRILRASGAPVPRRGRGREEVPPDLRGLGVTSREADVLRLAARGLRNTDIAERLYISPRTVKTHIANLRRKTGAADRRELLSVARRHLGGTPLS